MAKFTFNHTKQKNIERPVDVLDKQPGDYDVVSLESEILEVLSKVTVNPTDNKSTKPQKYSEQPVMMDLPVNVLKVARSIQRPYSITHCTGIAFENWDSRRPLFPIVVYNPIIDEYWIVEGNHTSMSQGARAAMGFYPDVEKNNWRNLKIRCQVVNLIPDENGHVDMSFCRDHFTGTNGDDRLKLADFDMFQNRVLKIKQDLAGDITKCDDDKAKTMYRLYCAAVKWDLTPVHPRSGRNTMLSGAINNLAAFMKLKVDDVDFIGKNHKQFWDGEVVDAIELLPMSVLRKLIDKNKVNPNEFTSKQHKQFMLEMAVVMQKFGTTPAGFRDFAVEVWKEFYNRTALIKTKKIPDPHKDFSLVLWLKLHQKVGGSYDCIPADVYTRFKENGIDAVDCVPLSKHKIFMDFK